MTLWTLLEVTVRASLVLAAALLAFRMLRRRSAAARHWVLAVGVVGALVVPVASALLPGWDPAGALAANADTTAATPRPSADGLSVETSTAIGIADDEGARHPSGSAPSEMLATTVVALWAAGAIVSLGMLLIGLVRLGWLSRGAEPVADQIWCEQADDLTELYGLRRRPYLVRSAHPTMLVAWGWLRPTVVVPASAFRWSPGRVRVVLAHEFAHVARADWTTLLAAELLRSIHWFNPLAWIVARRLRHESERACDDAVLDAGVDPSSYASQLVSIARELRARPTGLPAPAMAVPSSLERRILAMTNTTLDRRPLSRATRALAFATCLLFTVVVGTAQTTPGTLSGQILDQTGAALPGVNVTLSDQTGEPVDEGMTNIMGRFQFGGLPSGTYSFSAEMRGFRKFVQGSITLSAGNDVKHDVMLELGGLTETVEISGGRPSSGVSASVAPQRMREIPVPEPGCEPGGFDVRTDPSAVRVGGSIREPRKIRDLKPVYPAGLADEGVEGLVILEAVINMDGTIEDILILRDPHPGLSQAAVDAVNEWRYTPTLLNCQAFAIRATVTINFVAGG